MTTTLDYALAVAIGLVFSAPYLMEIFYALK
jgi:hypothetical protein